MTVSINILAMLVSLAMMLTGASADQPALTAKTLTISDVTITYNDQTVALNPALRMGAMTDGERSVFDVAVESGGEDLFPVQIAADGEALTALLANSGVAFSLPGSALEALVQQGEQMGMSMAGSMMADSEQGQEILDFMFNEYIPAYTALMGAMNDPDFQAEMNALSKPLLEEQVDRGEGVPGTVEYNGETYEAPQYSYTMDSAQMAALVDAVYTANDTLANYYNTLFKLYGMLPEESGLNGLSSFQEMFERMNIDMTADVTEWVDEAQALDIMNMAMTIDMQKMMIQAVEANGGDASDVPELEPMVINIFGAQVGDITEMTADFDYAMDEVRMAMAARAYTDALSQAFDMNMDMTVNGETMSMVLTSGSDTDEATGDAQFTGAFTMALPSDAGAVTASASGMTRADGSSDADVALNADVNGMNVGFTCHLNVGTEPFEDAAAAADAIVFSDLSDEAMQALMQDEAVAGKLMQVMGSFTEDAGKLMGEESVAELVQMFVDSTRGSIEDYTYDDTEAYDYGDTDDRSGGEPAFDVPEFTFLPEGWETADVEVDTEYGTNISMSLMKDGGDYIGNAFFYESYRGSTAEYVFGEDGSLTLVEDDLVTIDNSYGSWSVTRDDGTVVCNLYLYGDDVDLDTIGAILAGIQY